MKFADFSHFYHNLLTFHSFWNFRFSGNLLFFSHFYQNCWIFTELEFFVFLEMCWFLIFQQIFMNFHRFIYLSACCCPKQFFPSPMKLTVGQNFNNNAMFQSVFQLRRISKHLCKWKIPFVGITTSSRIPSLPPYYVRSTALNSPVITQTSPNHEIILEEFHSWKPKEFTFPSTTVRKIWWKQYITDSVWNQSVFPKLSETKNFYIPQSSQFQTVVWYIFI